MEMASGTSWTRQQSLVALNLYCQLPFGKLRHRNPEIIRCAQLIGRTPSALAMKLTNFASLDPAITSTGRSGLPNVSSADKAIWSEMQADWDRFGIEAREAATSLGVADSDATSEPQATDELPDYTGANRQAEVAVRIGQYSFRRTVLSAYDYRCCISGLAVPSLLVASHIKPWRVDERNRLNPRNGLCLSALHDRAFDAGIITITDEMTVSVSQAHATEADGFFQSALSSYHGRPITLPEKFPPAEEFLSYHRQHVFQG